MEENSKIQIAILSGLAGAGKTTASFAFEASGYYIVEDLPLKMVPGALSLFKSEKDNYRRVALILPLREVEEVARLIRRDDSFSLTTIGLDCRETTLLSRFKLTRHIHPLMTRGYSLEEALKADRAAMETARNAFDVYIDTSDLSEKQLRTAIYGVINHDGLKNLNVVFQSFGYKYGIPLDADIVVDARVLDNPYWVKELAPLTGLDDGVVDFIEKDAKTPLFLDSLYEYLDSFLRLCEKDGRTYVNVAVGCSGGQHRSVYVAKKLFERYRGSYRASLFHREMPRYRK